MEIQLSSRIWNARTLEHVVSEGQQIIQARLSESQGRRGVQQEGEAVGAVHAGAGGSGPRAAVAQEGEFPGLDVAQLPDVAKGVTTEGGLGDGDTHVVHHLSADGSVGP